MNKQRGEEPMRSFRIPGLSTEDVDSLPQQMQADIADVQAGRKHENDPDVDILPDTIKREISSIADEIAAFAQTVLYREGISLRAVQDSMRSNDIETQLTVERVRELIVERLMLRVDMITTEALKNAAVHGNKDPRKCIFGSYGFHANSGMLEIVVCDEGEGFSLDALPDPTENGHLDNPNGRGVMLMQHYTDCLALETQGTSGMSGSSVHMTKRLTGFEKTPYKEEQTRTQLDMMVAEVIRSYT